MKTRPSAGRRILYLLSTIEPFILDEAAGLARRGWSVRISSLDELAMWDTITGGTLPPGVVKLPPPRTDWHGMPAARLPFMMAVRLWRVFLRNPRRFLSLFAESRAAGSLRYFLTGSDLAGRLIPDPPGRIHSHFAWDAAFTGMWTAKLLGVPFSLTVHARDIFVARNPEMVASLLESSAPPLVVSRSLVPVMAEKWGEPVGARLVYIHPAIDLDALPRLLEPGLPQVVLCIASGLVEKKGIPVLLDACGAIARRRSGWKCVVAGSDDDGRMLGCYRSLAIERGLGEILEFSGLVRHDSLMQQAASASVFVLPCVRGADGDMDGMPAVLMEAMGMGLPVVSSRLSGIPELVEDGVSGILVPPGDAEALADAILDLLDDRGKATAMGRAAKERMVRGFGLGSHVELLERAWSEAPPAGRWMGRDREASQ